MLINNHTAFIKHFQRGCCEISEVFKIKEYQLELRAFVELFKAFVRVLTECN